MYFVTSFYQFLDLKSDFLDKMSAKISEIATQFEIKGLIILGPEGINSTVAAPSQESLNAFKKFILSLFKLDTANFKDSSSEKPPFRKFIIKIREEIVTLGTPELVPDKNKNHHLTPKEWNDVLQKEKDFVLIDTRNWYEYKIGSFKNALNPDIDKFTEFPEYLEQQKISKEQKMLIFCTGGVRCEKGILELQRQGYENVYQLDGGILKYIEEYPNQEFTGECFVFDHRVALDQNLKPSLKYGLCPHCGQPSEIKIQCKRCDFETLICGDCSTLEWKNVTCSKNCAYHYQLHPDRKAPHQWQPFELKHENIKVGFPSPDKSLPSK